MRISWFVAISATMGSVYGAISPELSLRARLMEILGNGGDYNLEAYIEAAPEDLFEEAMSWTKPKHIRRQLSATALKIYYWRSNGGKDLVLNLMNRLASVLHFEHPSYSRDDPGSFLQRIADYGVTQNSGKQHGYAPAFVSYFSQWISEKLSTSAFIKRCHPVKLEYRLFRPYLYPRNPLTTALSFECKIRFSQGIKDARQKLDELYGSEYKMSEEEYGKVDRVFAGFLEHQAFTREIAINLDCSDLCKMSEYIDKIMSIHGFEDNAIDATPTKGKKDVQEAENERPIKRKWAEIEAERDVPRAEVLPLPAAKEVQVQAAGKFTVELELNVPSPEVLPLPAVKDFLVKASRGTPLTPIFFDALPEAIVREGVELEKIRANNPAIHSFLDFVAARVLELVYGKYSATGQYLMTRIVELLNLSHSSHNGSGSGQSWIDYAYMRYTTDAYDACKAHQFVRLCLRWRFAGCSLDDYIPESYVPIELECFQPYLYPRNPLTKVMSLNCKIRFAQMGEHSREFFSKRGVSGPKVSEADVIRLNSVFSRFLSHPAFNLEIATKLDCTDPFLMADFMEQTMNSYQGDPNQHVPVIAVEDRVNVPSMEVMNQLKAIIREYKEKATEAAEKRAAEAKQNKEFLVQAAGKSVYTSIFFDALPESIVRKGVRLEKIRANNPAIHAFLDFVAGRVLDFVDEKYSVTAEYLMTRIVKLLNLSHSSHDGSGSGESWIEYANSKYNSGAFDVHKAHQFVSQCLLRRSKGCKPRSYINDWYPPMELECFQPFLYPRNPLTKVMTLDCKIRFSQLGENSRGYLAPYNIRGPKVSDADAIWLNSVISRFLNHPAFNLEMATKLRCSDPFLMADFMEHTINSYQGDPSQHVPVLSVDDPVTEPSLEVMNQLREIIDEYEKIVIKAAEKIQVNPRSRKITKNMNFAYLIEYKHHLCGGKRS